MLLVLTLLESRSLAVVPLWNNSLSGNMIGQKNSVVFFDVCKTHIPVKYRCFIAGESTFTSLNLCCMMMGRIQLLEIISLFRIPIILIHVCTSMSFQNGPSIVMLLLSVPKYNNVCE